LERRRRRPPARLAGRSPPRSRRLRRCSWWSRTREVTPDKVRDWRPSSTGGVEPGPNLDEPADWPGLRRDRVPRARGAGCSARADAAIEERSRSSGRKPLGDWTDGPPPAAVGKRRRARSTSVESFTGRYRRAQLGRAAERSRPSVLTEHPVSLRVLSQVVGEPDLVPATRKLVSAELARFRRRSSRHSDRLPRAHSELVVSRMDAADRQALHGRFVQALQRPAGRDLAALTEHYLGAADARCRACAVKAAQSAASALAFQRACWHVPPGPRLRRHGRSRNASTCWSAWARRSRSIAAPARLEPSSPRPPRRSPLPRGAGRCGSEAGDQYTGRGLARGGGSACCAWSFVSSTSTSMRLPAPTSSRSAPGSPSAVFGFAPRAEDGNRPGDAWPGWMLCSSPARAGVGQAREHAVPTAARARCGSTPASRCESPRA